MCRWAEKCAEAIQLYWPWSRQCQAPNSSHDIVRTTTTTTTITTTAWCERQITFWTMASGNYIIIVIIMCWVVCCLNALLWVCIRLPLRTANCVPYRHKWIECRDRLFLRPKTIVVCHRCRRKRKPKTHTHTEQRSWQKRMSRVLTAMWPYIIISSYTRSHCTLPIASMETSTHNVGHLFLYGIYEDVSRSVCCQLPLHRSTLFGISFSYIESSGKRLVSVHIATATRT